MIGQSNVTHIVVGKDDDLATSSETRADLIAGQIGVFLVGSTTAIGTGATDLAAGDKFQIVYKRVDGALIQSPVVEYSNITNKKATATAVAATQRVRALGFNGVSGTIDVANSEDYVVHYNWDDGKKVFGNGRPLKFIAYKSSSSATQVEIAGGLVANSINSRDKNPVVVGNLLINSAGTAVPTGVDTITLKKGSKYFTATDIDDATGTAALAVGDYLRVGTALTSVCYEITAIDTTNNVGTLAYAYQGADYAAVDTNFEVIVTATAASAAAGLQLVGQVMPFEAGIKTYNIIEFKFEMVGEGFGSTTVSSTATPSKGVGTYKEIAEHEWFLRGNRGETWRNGNYPKTITLDAQSDKTYSQVTFDYEDTNATTIDRKVSSFGSIFIATEEDSAGGAHASLVDILNIS